MVNWKWTARQLEAWCMIAQFILYGGAKGGGKTVYLCRWAVLKCAQFPGNKVFLGRRRAIDFKNTTLETFVRYVDPGLYRINKNEKRIYLPWCNGQIDYGGLDDPQVIDKFNSAEYGAIGIDQAEEVDRDQLASLVGTLRHTLPDGTHPDFQVLLTANPAECFLKYDFIEHPKQGNLQTGAGHHVFIKALHTDNPFLPADYIPNLKEQLKHRPKLLKAYIEGIWDNLAAVDILIQPSWVEICKANRWPVDAVARRRVIYCDVARQGDDECVTYGLEAIDKMAKSRIFFEHIQGYTDNLADLGDFLIATRRKTNSMLLGLDAVGIGAGVFDYIRRKKDDDGNPEPVFGFIGGSTELPEPVARKYTNLKSWVWHAGADDIRDGKVCLPDDTVLTSQLLWQKTIIVSEIRSRVLTKKELKDTHKQSPDRGEAFINGLHCLKISKDLPDNTPRSSAKEFWDLVKKDQARINNEEGDIDDDGFEEV